MVDNRVQHIGTFASIHTVHIIACILSFAANCYFAILLKRCRTIYSTTRTALTVGGIAGVLTAAAGILYSALLLLDARFELNALITARNNGYCKAFLTATTAFSEVSIGSICIVATERMVVLRSPQRIQKSSLTIAIGLLTVLLRTTCFISFYFFSESKFSEICDLTLFVSRNFTFGVALLTSHCLQMFLLLIALTYIRRKSKTLLNSYCINHTLLNIATRLTLERSVKVARVLTRSVLMGAAFYPVINVWSFFGPNAVSTDESTKHILSVALFYTLIEIGYCINAVNGLCLLRIDHPKSRRRQRLLQCNRASISGPTETELRFAALEKEWSKGFK